MTEQRRSIHVPRKRFGQNFLIDQGIIDRIIATIGPQPEDHLVEIGPGQGALTHHLVASGARLTLIELDRDLVVQLIAEFEGNSRVEVISADALKTDFCELSRGRPLRIVGNLPYNISTPLLFHLMSQIKVMADMHFMLQKEVVARIAAKPGSGDWGRLGIMLQYYCDTEKLLDVPASAFHPAPKVESSVVRLVPKPDHREEPSAQALETVVRTAFNNRRKTLRNSLKPLIQADQLEQLGIDPQARPETLALDDFLRIAHQVSES